MVTISHNIDLHQNSFVVSITHTANTMTPTTNDSKNLNTTTDAAVWKTQDLYELSFRVVNAVNELTVYCKVLEDSKSSANKRRQCLSNIKNTIVPFMSSLSTTIADCSKAGNSSCAAEESSTGSTKEQYANQCRQ